MARVRFIPDASKASLAWRAMFALNGEQPPKLIQEYLTEAVATLEKIYTGEASENETKSSVAQLVLFLRVLLETSSPTGRSRTALSLRKRRGRPRQGLPDVMRGLTAVDMVDRRVADGWKQEAAVRDVGDKLGMSRTEIFEWLKRDREFELPTELCPE